MVLAILILVIINTLLLLFNIVQVATTLRVLIVTGKLLTGVNELLITFTKYYCETTKAEIDVDKIQKNFKQDDFKQDDFKQNWPYN